MSCKECDEQHYVIDKLAKLLADIAIIVNGPEPPLTRWSYHDLPEKVRALKQAPPAAAVPDVAGLDSAIHLAAIGDKSGACKALLEWAEATERNGVGNG